MLFSKKGQPKKMKIGVGRMVCGDKLRLWLNTALLCVGFIILVVGILAGCGGMEAERETDTDIGAEEDTSGNTDVIGQEKDLGDNDADDTVQVLIQDEDNATHVQIDFEETSLSFSYPSFLAEGINARITECPWGSIPEYNYIHFDNNHGTSIKLIPIEDLSLLSDFASKRIDEIEAIIEAKNIPSDTTVSSFPFKELPVLPSIEAPWQFYSNVELLESKTSNGLRFLMRSAQGEAPVYNQDLYYYYSGITTDRNYYISASFPVSFAALSRHNEDYFESKGIHVTDHSDGWFEIQDWGAWVETYGDYMDVTLRMLEGADADDFEPSLLLFDELINSIQIK